MKTKLVKKCLTGLAMRNSATSALDKLFDKGAKAVSKILTPIDRFLSTNRPALFVHSNGSGYPGFAIGAHKPIIIKDSPAREAAALSVVGHGISLILEKTPAAPLGNALDIVTSTPDAVIDIIHAGAELSPESFKSVFLDFPEILEKTRLDDVVSWGGFADDLKLASDGTIDLEQAVKSKLISKNNKK